MATDRLELKTSLTVPLLLGVFLGLPIVILGMIGKTVGLVVVGALALAYVWLCVKLARRRLILDGTSIMSKGAFATTKLDWNEIEYYTYWSSQQHHAYAAGAQGGVIGMLVAVAVVAAVNAGRTKATANRRFSMGRLKMVTRDGRALAISSGTQYKNAGEAIDRAFTELHARLRNAAVRDYAPFVLTATELTHSKKGPIGLADIERVKVANGRLTVHKRGKRLAWCSAQMRKTTNGMLFVEDLAEHGIVVDASRGVFVPPTVLDKLRAATARQASLPQARIVQR